MDAANDPVIAGIIRSFLERLPESIAEIETAMRDGDDSNLKFLVHRLKGRCMTCCFSQLAEELAAWECLEFARGESRLAEISEAASSSILEMEQALNGFCP